MFGMRKRRRAKKVKVVVGADTLEQKWAGGLDAVKVSNIPENMYNEGERVLAFHDDDLLYEGKVREMHFAEREKQWNYWIHYAGWSHRWDTWIYEDRVLKYNEGNLEQQQQMKEAVEKVRGKSPRRYSNKRSIGSEPSSDVESSIDSASSIPVAVVAPKARRSGKRVKVEPESEPAKETKKSDDLEESDSNPKQELRIKVLKKSIGKTTSRNVEPESELAKESDCVDPEEGNSNSKMELRIRVLKKSIGSGTSGVIVSTTDSRSSTPIVDEALDPEVIVKVEPAEPEEEVAVGEDSDCVELVIMEEGQEGHSNPTQEVSIEIPKKLEKFLVLDNESVTYLKRLVNLPARVTIEQIFTEYLKEKKKSDKNSIELYRVVCDGLRSYFNSLIGTQLLYQFEKAQFQQLKDKNEEKPMTGIYGAAHLLRLFTRLGSCLATASLDDEGIADIQKRIEDFFKFMLENYDKYLTLEDYTVVCSES